MIIRLIIAGSRRFNDYSRAKDYLDRRFPLGSEIVVISGTAQGADRIGEQWAESRGYPVIQMPAPWEKYGKRAGYIRNLSMVEAATHCVCFWDGWSRGTKHMIDIAEQNKLELAVVKF